MIFPVLVVSAFLISSAEPGIACAQDNQGQPNGCFLTSEKITVRPADPLSPPFILGLTMPGRIGAGYVPASATASRFSTGGTGRSREQAAPSAKACGTEAPDFRDFGRALGYNFTKGLFARKNLRPLLIGSVATLAFVPFDRKISDAFRGDVPEFGDIGNVAGGPAAMASVTGGLLVAAPFTKNARYRSYVFSQSQAMVLVNAQVFALKYLVRRTRPDESSQNSFPSAHAANLFALATVTSHYYGKKIGIPLYIVACLVAASRVERGSHFPSDAIFGATLGYISARTAIRGTQHVISAGRGIH
jgi:membrane-associated phospholipid phosphatase